MKGNFPVFPPSRDQIRAPFQVLLPRRTRNSLGLLTAIRYPVTLLEPGEEVVLGLSIPCSAQGEHVCALFPGGFCGFRFCGATSF